MKSRSRGSNWFVPVATMSRPRLQCYVSDSDDLCGIEEWQLREGKAITKWSPEAWIKSSSRQLDGLYVDDVLQTHLGVPIYSKRLQSVLAEIVFGNIQFLPLRVLRSDGSPIPGYAVANICTAIPALDHGKSKYTVYPNDYFLKGRRGHIWLLLKPVLRSVSLEGHHAFRLSEFPAAEFVSQRFKEVFEESGCTGYSFERAEVC